MSPPARRSQRSRCPQAHLPAHIGVDEPLATRLAHGTQVVYEGGKPTYAAQRLGTHTPPAEALLWHSDGCVGPRSYLQRQPGDPATTLWLRSHDRPHAGRLQPIQCATRHWPCCLDTHFTTAVYESTPSLDFITKGRALVSRMSSVYSPGPRELLE